MDILQRIGISIAYLSVAAATVTSVCGALFVMPGLNGGEPSQIWSLIGILSALVWGSLIWFADELPRPSFLAFGIAMCMLYLSVCTLALLQGLLLLLWVPLSFFGYPPTIDREFILLCTNCLMLLILLAVVALMFLEL